MFIEYVKRSNSFKLTVNFGELSLVRALPSRRFNPSKGVWFAPCVRRNIEAINNWVNPPEVTTEVKDILKEKGVFKSDNIFPIEYTYKTEPRDYQVIATHKAYAKEMYALFMEMGLGKSKISLDVMAASIGSKEIEQILIICPYSVRIIWPDEIAKHFPRDSDIHLADLKTKAGLKRFDNFNNYNDKNRCNILVVGVESLQRKGNKAYESVYNYVAKRKTGIIVDEVHYIKNPQSIRTLNITSIGENAIRKIAMTGTPVSQGIIDLYSILNFLDPNIIGLGDYYSFKNRYCVMGGFEQRDIIGYKNTDELFSIIKPFVHQCFKKDVLNIPDKIYQVRYVTMLKEQAKTYKTLKEEGIFKKDSVDEGFIVEHMLTLYGNLQQVLSGFIREPTGDFKFVGNKSVEVRKTVEIIQSNKNPKIVELKNIINDIPENEQIIIWAKYSYEVELLRKELLYYKTDKFEKSMCIYNDTQTDEERSTYKNEFNEKKIRYFISTQKKGGTGLTLNTASYVVYFTNDFSYVYRTQSEDRNHRIGQERHVTYIDICYADTIDKRVLDCLKKKKNVADYVKDSLQANDSTL